MKGVPVYELMAEEPAGSCCPIMSIMEPCENTTETRLLVLENLNQVKSILMVKSFKCQEKPRDQ